MREAQQETMTQTYTVMYNPNPGPINATSKDMPADLGQVTGERLSIRAFAKPTQTQGQETRYRKT